MPFKNYLILSYVVFAVVPNSGYKSVAAAPTVSGRLATATTFYAYVNVADGTCQIFIGTDANKTLYDLTDETDAGNYKKAN